MSIEYRDSYRWRMDAAQSADHVLGEPGDVVGEAADSAYEFLKSIFGEDIKTLHRVISMDVFVRRGGG